MSPDDDSSSAAPKLPAPVLSPAEFLAIPELDRRAHGPRAARAGGWRRRLALIASVALVAVAASAATVMVASLPQAERVSESVEATHALAKSLAALNARLDAIEKTRPRDDLGDIRKAVGELKTGPSKEVEAALARLSQRIETLDRQQSAKVEKLDSAADARGADLAQRLDKLEKKLAAPPPQTAAVKPAAPKLGPNVSMETTASIKPAPAPLGPVARERPVLSGYVVLGASPNAAVIADRWGERAFRIGDVVPGAGRVQRIERRAGSWVVRTEAGLIPPAELDPVMPD